MISREQAKFELLEKIASGSSRQELIAYINASGWSVGRNRPTYFSAVLPNGQRVRLKHDDPNFEFEAPAATGKAKNKTQRRFLEGEQQLKLGKKVGYWIYILFATDTKNTACYVGQTTHLGRRLSEHTKRRNGKSSSELFDWAESNNSPVKCLVLDYVGGENSAHRASLREGSWLMLAKKNGLMTPAESRWGKLPFEDAWSQLQWPTSIEFQSAHAVEKILGSNLSLNCVISLYLTVRLKELTAQSPPESSTSSA